ncbi:alpha/beta hydrolase [Yoonia sp. BS5-3]|uniref:Alpha/beta fold hydrolase n=1 Tax=Yoonia phaeophyticola TaxID=3137369 RepID=A0ABZ2V0M2_9RHOB
MKSRDFPQYDGALRYHERDGAGRPLVMLHGLGCAASYEFPNVVQTAPLADRHVLMLDLYGFGYSDRPKAFGYSISDHAAALAAFVQALDLGSFDLFGHSMGGAVAIEAAHLLDGQVAHLILAESNLDPGIGLVSKTIAAGTEEAYCDQGHDRIIVMALETGNTAWAATLRASDPRAVYRGARSLVQGGQQSWRELLYAHGGKKSFFIGQNNLPDPNLDLLPAHGVETFVIPHAGHAMGLDNPAGLAEAIAQVAPWR